MHSIPFWAFLLVAFVAAAAGLLAWLLLRVNRRIASLKEGMALHSELTLRLKLREENVPVVWWDPTIEPWPDMGKRHRNRGEFSHVVLGMPEHLRWGSVMCRYVQLLVLGVAGTFVAALWLFGWGPGVVSWLAVWKSELLFAALMLFGLLFLYALVQCSRKLFQREWLRQNAPPAQTLEKR